MVQESVYSKLSLNQNAANALIMKVKHNKPTVGLVQILTVTEKQYANMEMIVGDSQNDIIDSSERMIVL